MSSARSRLRDLRQRVGAVLATAAVLTSVLAAPANAEQSAATPPPAATPPAQSPAKPISLTGVPPGTHEITLISGDKVILTATGDGRFQWKIEPATRLDGRTPVLIGRTEADGMYLIPQDALPAIETGLLDRDLFNITYLAENGFTDAKTKQVPVIAQYARATATGRLRATADAVPASAPGVTLESINANELSVSKADAGTFWQAVTGGVKQVRALRGGLSRIWLDRRVEATLSESVPLIGAPQAWAAGLDGSGVRVAVLDTGIDQNHPDLKDKVVASASFVSDTVADGHGHGTHVASTIAGSGAASGGQHRGVAPGADLLIAKVLDDSGSGPTSGVIEAMEWAAQQVDADIVSLSLGAGPSDGTDPASQAVNNLTASTGALFVIAAGNDGPAAETVASPGTAAAALTVSATTKNDELAGFSSRGPRLDGALKPDLAAPGVNIVAARAEGTALCAGACVQPGDGPVDDWYTSASGTSMATPHVSGAAAILAQKYPDWSPARYKAALMSTSTDAGHTAYEQGAGRLDVARAITQQVWADTAQADFGRVDAGLPPASRDITYTNQGDQPVTLTLAGSLRDTDGGATPDVLTLPDTVTVPAGASATITVTMDTATLDEGVYSGAVVATDGAGVRLSTPIGIVRDAPVVTVELTVPTLPVVPAENAGVLFTYGILDVAGDRGPLGKRIHEIEPGRAIAKIPRGTYEFTVIPTWVDEGLRANAAFLVLPEVTIEEDTKLTFDGLDAKELTFSSPHGPLATMPEGSSLLMTIDRILAPGKVWTSFAASASYYRYWATPTRPTRHGELVFTANYVLGHPEVEMRVAGRHGMTLHPTNYPHIGGELHFLTGYRHFEGRQRLELVDVGHASAEEIAGLDLRGKLALLDNDQPCWMSTERVHNVRDAGAAGILAWTSTPQNTTCGGGPTVPITIRPSAGEQDTTVGIPFTSISPNEARSLLGKLDRGPVSIDVTGTPKSPYRYLTTIIESGIPRSLHFHLGDRQVTTVDMEYHGAEGTVFEMSKSAYRTDQMNWFPIDVPTIRQPGTQTTYMGPVYRGVLNIVEVRSANSDEIRLFTADRPSRVRMRWNTGVQTPGPMLIPNNVLRLYDGRDPSTFQRFLPCHFCRQGDALVPSFSRVSADGRADGIWLAPGTTRLYRDGVEVPIGGPPLFPFTMPKEDANYRLTMDEGNNSVEWRFRSSTVTRTGTAGPLVCLREVYEGKSEPCRPEPLVYVTYDLGASQAVDNTVSAKRTHRFTVRATHSPAKERMPDIAGLRLWTSTDGGRTWEPARVKRPRGASPDQSFDVMVKYPRRIGPNTTVSLKAEAWDADGNRVTQVTRDAFRLR